MDPNPYAHYLGESDPMEIIATTASRLSHLTAGLGPEVCNRSPAPGKWSVREIVAHLADTDMVFGFRLRQILAEDNPTLQPFDQGIWAERYAAYDLDSAITLFTAVRGWNIKLLKATTDAERQRHASHPERGPLTLWTIVQTMAGHDINHLNQTERLALGRV